MSFVFYFPLNHSKFSYLLLTIKTLSQNEQPLLRGSTKQWQWSTQVSGGFAKIKNDKFYSRVLGFANWKHYQVFQRKEKS